MAERTFEIRTEPNVANIGGKRLLFQAEVIGSEFIEAYTQLQQIQMDAAQLAAPRRATATRHAKPGVTAQDLAKVEAAIQDYLKKFMLPESHDDFDAIRLPQRILIEMVEWTAEVYGGGSGNPEDGTGPSSD